MPGATARFFSSLPVSQQHLMMMMVFGGSVSRVAPIGWLNKLWVVKHPHGSPQGAWLLSRVAGVATDKSHSEGKGMSDPGAAISLLHGQSKRSKERRQTH